MAADIFFTEIRAWSSSSAFFCDIMQRSISKCRNTEDSLIQVLLEAEEGRCLSIDLEEDHCDRVTLTERVLEGSQEILQELSADPATHPETLKILEALVATAQEHLRELNSESA